MEKSDFRELFIPADILLPTGCDMKKWSVVACDQHTSEPEYWERVDNFVGGAPSTLRMMLPEHTYKYPNIGELISNAKASMARYEADGIFKVYESSYIYVERELYNGKLRRGIVGAIDLECYDYTDGTKAAVRATEGTVVEKLPIRIKLREDAPIELTHVLVLVDDPDMTLIEPLSDEKNSMQKLYDFELMEKGGHIAGYRITGELIERVKDAVAALADSKRFNGHYGLEDEPIMVFATGDGNHSLATAKHCWEKLKPTLSEEERKTHPARYALVEIVNIRDSSLEFQPINRVVFDVDPEAMVGAMLDYFPDSHLGHGGDHEICFVHGDHTGIISLPKDSGALAIGALSKFLDEYVPSVGGRIDFVHGDDVVVKLSQKPGRLGFVLPAIDKSSLFLSIIQDGALPRKTFSMGSSNDKRFYLECRRIR
ncbi:MAG TPA: DUF1015 domain-containing protein [Clostridiales bacterium]|jgi:hypothetical protein|nr:DUF1015 domain-containing protein [Clostridiales bacterium]